MSAPKKGHPAPFRQPEAADVPAQSPKLPSPAGTDAAFLTRPPVSRTAQLILETATEREDHQAKEYYSQGLRFYRISFWAAIATAAVGCFGFLICVGWLFVPKQNELQTRYRLTLQQRDDSQSELRDKGIELSDKQQQSAELEKGLHVALAAVFGPVGAGNPAADSPPAGKQTELDQRIDKLRTEIEGTKLGNSVTLFATEGFSDNAIPPVPLKEIYEGWRGEVRPDVFGRISTVFRTSLGSEPITDLKVSLEGSGTFGAQLLSKTGSIPLFSSPKNVPLMVLNESSGTASPTSVPPALATNVPPVTAYEGPTELLTLVWYRSHVDGLFKLARIVSEESKILTDIYGNLRSDATALPAEAKAGETASGESKGAAAFPGLKNDTQSLGALSERAGKELLRVEFLGGVIDFLAVGSYRATSGESTLSPTDSQKQLLRGRLVTSGFLSAPRGRNPIPNSPFPSFVSGNHFESIQKSDIKGEMPQEFPYFAVYEDLWTNGIADTLRDDIVQAALSIYKVGLEMVNAKRLPEKIASESRRLSLQQELDQALQQKNEQTRSLIDKQGEKKKVDKEIQTLKDWIDNKLKPRADALETEAKSLLTQVELQRKESGSFLAEKAGPLIGAIAAAIVQLVGGLFLLLANRTQRTASADFDRARADRRFRQAFVLVEEIDDLSLRNQCKARMALELAGAEDRELQPPAPPPEDPKG